MTGRGGSRIRPSPRFVSPRRRDYRLRTLAAAGTVRNQARRRVASYDPSFTAQLYIPARRIRAELYARQIASGSWVQDPFSRWLTLYGSEGGRPVVPE